MAFMSPWPPWSFAGPSRMIGRPAPLRNQLVDLWRWLRPKRQTLAERMREQRRLAELAEEIAEAEEHAPDRPNFPGPRLR
jgi:hypothetical protein